MKPILTHFLNRLTVRFPREFFAHCLPISHLNLTLPKPVPLRFVRPLVPCALSQSECSGKESSNETTQRAVPESDAGVLT